VSYNGYDSIAEQFERDEKQKFGDDGFEKVIDHVAQIARMIGVDDLAKFTRPDPGRYGTQPVARTCPHR
jgi:hypothetical protein